MTMLTDRLLGASLVSISAGLMFPGSALAQEVKAAGAEQVAIEDAQGDAADIVVTGSRIVRDGYMSPSPVTIASAQDMLAATPSNLADGLNKLPQFSNSTGPRANSQLQANSGEHGNILNLRSLGGNRTLIMLDNLRVAPTTFKGAVDVNTLPQLLVQRVEVVTAGASAAYGSDALSGVVNYILDSRFKGLRAVAQSGVSGRGDQGSYKLGAAFGTSFFNGRGHLVLSAERAHSGEVVRSSRVYGDSQSAAVGATGVGAAGSATNPFIFITGGTNTSLYDGGLIKSSTIPAFVGQRFGPDGTLATLKLGAPTGTGGVRIGGEGAYTPGYGTLAAPLTTDQFFGRLSYDVSDSVSAYVQGSYARSKTSYASQAAFIQGARIFSDNAFLKPGVQAQMGPKDNFVLTAFQTWVGPIRAHESTDSTVITAGLFGDLEGGWSWRIDGSYSEAETSVSQNNYDHLKLYAAIDAVRDGSGNVVCRVQLTNPGLFPGCIPYNPFGAGAASQSAIDYATGETWYRAKTKMEMVAGSVQGDIFDLPAGAVSVAAGIEYRRQQLNMISNSDPSLVLDQTALRASTTQTRFAQSNFGVAKGRVEVKELFGEVAVPILADKPYAQKLELNAAGRLTDYSTSGNVQTWKVGAVWAPSDAVRFRLTRSRDIRAPSLFELFAGTQQSAALINDPHTNVSGSFRQYTGGNPNLRPEIGDTLSVGVVLQPTFVPGFSISVDYYNIRIKDAVNTQSAFDILNGCEASGGTSQACSLITRPNGFADRSPGNFPTRIDVLSQNIAFLKTSGIDVDMSYRRDVGPGRLDLRVFATWVRNFEQQTNSLAPVYDYAGYGANGNLALVVPRLRTR